MPIQPLPDDPSLENLRKQAKSLVKAIRASDPEALARVREFHPRPENTSTKFSLSDAQFVIARSHGFSSWSKLKRHLDVLDQHSLLPRPQTASEDSEPITDRFVRLACLNYLDDHTRWRDKARELLASHPSICRENIYTAATVGDVAAVTQLLETSPTMATRRGGPYNWEPLLYAGYSRLNSNAAQHSTLEVARLLLAHGADPNGG